MPKALSNLKSSIARVRLIADDVDTHAADALRNPSVQERHETSLCAGTVILSGFFESFLKEMAEEVILEISSRAVPFIDLPAKLRFSHFYHGAMCLKEIAQKEKKQNPVVLAEAQDIVRRLGSINGTGPYEIVWEAFADTRSNPGPEQLGDYFKRFGIEKPLETLGAAMKPPSNAVSIRLKSFMSVRHECAHTGSAKIMPTTSDVRGYCDLIESIADGVEQVFKDMLNAAPYVGAALPVVAASVTVVSGASTTSAITGMPPTTAGTAAAMTILPPSSQTSVAASGASGSIQTPSQTNAAATPARNAPRRFCDQLLRLIRRLLSGSKEWLLR